MSKRILLVEDEPGFVLTLTDSLTSEDYKVESERDGGAGFERASNETFDAFILDVMLPRKNGFDVCHDLRLRAVNTPILMLTALGQVVDKVVGVRLGADDYLTKPFEMIELLARVEALLGRAPAAQPPQSEAYQFGSIKIDFRRAEVERDSEKIELSAKEFQLHQALDYQASAEVYFQTAAARQKQTAVIKSTPAAKGKGATLNETLFLS